MASSKPLDIVARFRTVTTDFNTREVERELSDADRAFIRSQKAAGTWSTTVRKAADTAVPRRGSGRWKAAGADLGAEFSQNIGEGISSGKGGIVGAVDTVLGTLGGFLPALGPAGAVAGIGFLVAKTIGDGIAAQQAALAKRTSDAIDAAAKVVIDNAEWPSLSEIITTLTPEEKADLRRAGVSIADYATAIYEFQTKGNPTKLNALKGAIEGQVTAAQNLVNAYSGGASGVSFKAYSDAMDTLERVGGAASVINRGSSAVLDAAAAAAEFAGTLGRIPDKDWNRVLQWRKMFGSQSAGTINLSIPQANVTPTPENRRPRD